MFSLFDICKFFVFIADMLTYIESVNVVVCVVQGTVKPGSHQFFVYDNVTLQQAASVNDIIVASSDTAYLLTDAAVRVSGHFSL